MQPARSLRLASFLTALALASACASTREGDEHDVLKTWEASRFDQLFRMVDADADGHVGPEEFAANYVGVTWRYFDKDGDSFISMEEWVLDGASPERVAWFRTLDTDRDLRVSEAEFRAATTDEAIARYFALMDADGDGTITKKDLGR